MSAVERTNPVSVEDYLAGELVSTVKHEYLGGLVYAMAGARNVHNLIASKVFDGVVFTPELGEDSDEKPRSGHSGRV